MTAVLEIFVFLLFLVSLPAAAGMLDESFPDEEDDSLGAAGILNRMLGGLAKA